MYQKNSATAQHIIAISTIAILLIGLLATATANAGGNHRTPAAPDRPAHASANGPQGDTLKGSITPVKAENPETPAERATEAEEHTDTASKTSTAASTGTAHAQQHRSGRKPPADHGKGASPSAHGEKAKQPSPENDDTTPESAANAGNNGNADSAPGNRYGIPCTKFCNISVDEIVHNIQQLKQYVDWTMTRHRNRYNHSRFHTHTGEPQHDHQAYLPRNAADRFATIDHPHADNDTHTHKQYAPQGHSHDTTVPDHTHPELQHTHDTDVNTSALRDWTRNRDAQVLQDAKAYADRQTAGTKKGVPPHQHRTYAPQDHAHAALEQRMAALESTDHGPRNTTGIGKQLGQQMKQYIRKHGTVVNRVSVDVDELRDNLRQWTRNTFATKQNVARLQQQNRQLRRELAYLKQATGHTQLRANTAARVMARNNYSTLTYGDTTCHVYRFNHGNHTGKRKVQCIR